MGKCHGGSGLVGVGLETACGVSEGWYVKALDIGVVQGYVGSCLRRNDGVGAQE